MTKPRQYNLIYFMWVPLSNICAPVVQRQSLLECATPNADIWQLLILPQSTQSPLEDGSIPSPMTCFEGVLYLKPAYR